MDSDAQAARGTGIRTIPDARQSIFGMPEDSRARQSPKSVRLRWTGGMGLLRLLSLRALNGALSRLGRSRGCTSRSDDWTEPEHMREDDALVAELTSGLEKGGAGMVSSKQRIAVRSHMALVLDRLHMIRDRTGCAVSPVGSHTCAGHRRPRRCPLLRPAAPAAPAVAPGRAATVPAGQLHLQPRAATPGPPLRSG